MILSVPDEYRVALITFLELGLNWIDMDEKEAARKGVALTPFADDELAVLEIVRNFVEQEWELVNVSGLTP